MFFAPGNLNLKALQTHIYQYLSSLSPQVIDFSHGLAIYERCPRAVEPLWVEVRFYWSCLLIVMVVVIVEPLWVEVRFCWSCLLIVMVVVRICICALRLHDRDSYFNVSVLPCYFPGRQHVIVNVIQCYFPGRGPQ